jgi:transcriptional regulator
VRQNPSFALSDPGAIKQLVRDHPWITLVSHPEGGLVASHYPAIVDEEREELSLVSHVGRPDDLVHELGRHEVLVIVQGPHGYVSPSWYDADPAVPTWNYVVAHLSGVPELLDPDENLRMLGRLVDHFEAPLPEPRAMLGTPADAAYATRISSGTVGFRLTPTRVVAKAKLSQNKPRHIAESVLAQLEGDGPYAQPALAEAMRAVLSTRRG